MTRQRQANHQNEQLSSAFEYHTVKAATVAPWGRQLMAGAPTTIVLAETGTSPSSSKIIHLAATSR